MEDYLGLFLLVFVYLTSCRAQQDFRPTNLTAVYVADGTIRVTWDPPATLTGLTQYVVKVEGIYGYVKINLNQRVYSYNTTKPDTTYVFRVSSIITGIVRGTSQTYITTPSAIYRQRGEAIRLNLPKPPGGLSTIKFNGQTLFTFANDDLIGYNDGSVNGVTVNVTSSNTKLTIDLLETNHAGYYYTMQQSGEGVLGGEFLVVTDLPNRPNIIPSSSSPVLGTSVIFECASSSRSKPDNHGLTLRTSWKVNGSAPTSARYSINDTSLVINPVRYRDKYNVYTCVANEEGHGIPALSSEESEEFKLTPRYGPQFLRIEDTEGKSPVIRGDVYGPVVCRTDCNPPCLLEWRRQGVTLITSRGTSSNQLDLVDRNLPRVKEVIYSCHVQVKSSAGFSAPSMENNITVTVFFPPNITNLRHQDSIDNQYMSIGSSDVRKTEGSSLELRVNVDSSPDADVILLRNQANLAISVPVSTGIRDIKLDNLQCNQTGRYDVRAVNFVTRNRSNANPSSRQFGLQVNCAPRRFRTTNSIIRMTGEKDQIVELNVTVVANPKPSIQWSNGVRALGIIQNNGYTYTIRGDVTITKESDFQKYHLNVTNTSPNVLTVLFQISPTSVPDIPVDFHASKVSYNYVSVVWTSGYNGGISQYFHIEFMTVGSEWSPGNSLGIPDTGQGSLMKYTLLYLTSATDYTIRLKVSNKHGSRISTEIRVRTLETPQKPDTQLYLTIGLVTGGLVLLFCIVVIIALVIKIKRRHQDQTDANLEQNTPGNTTGLELQSRVAIHVRSNNAEDEQGHVYAVADDGLPYQEQRHVYAVADDVKQSDDGLPYQDVNPYMELEPTKGHEHVYNTTTPEQLGSGEDGGRTSRDSKDVNQYMELEQSKGQEHVYDMTNPEHQGSGANG